MLRSKILLVYDSQMQMCRANRKKIIVQIVKIAVCRLADR